MIFTLCLSTREITSTTTHMKYLQSGARIVVKQQLGSAPQKNNYGRQVVALVCVTSIGFILTFYFWSIDHYMDG